MFCCSQDSSDILWRVSQKARLQLIGWCRIIGVARGGKGYAPQISVCHALWFCASRSGVPNQIALFASIPNIRPLPNVWAGCATVPHGECVPCFWTNWMNVVVPICADYTAGNKFTGPYTLCFKQQSMFSWQRKTCYAVAIWKRSSISWKGSMSVVPESWPASLSRNRFANCGMEPQD